LPKNSKTYHLRQGTGGGEGAHSRASVAFATASQGKQGWVGWSVYQGVLRISTSEIYDSLRKE